VLFIAPFSQLEHVLLCIVVLYYYTVSYRVSKQPAARDHAAHSTNFDEKVYKPQSYLTLEVAMVKKSKSDRKTKNSWKLIFFSTCFAFFHPGAHNSI
jgi:mannose/cellobiose epimerase-like protein (N-acyl-D-glucosamine 2-epimerase family)